MCSSITRSCTVAVPITKCQLLSCNLNDVLQNSDAHYMSASRLKQYPNKTKLLWAGSKSVSSVALSLQIDSDTVTALVHVRVIGVTFSSDLSIDKHVCAACLYWLQLRRVRRSLDNESVTVLVHAFVTARMDYCNMVLAGAPRSVTDRLQRALNTAGLSQLLHADLHWLELKQNRLEE